MVPTFGGGPDVITFLTRRRRSSSAQRRVVCHRRNGSGAGNELRPIAAPPTRALQPLPPPPAPSLSALNIYLVDVRRTSANF